MARHLAHYFGVPGAYTIGALVHDTEFKYAPVVSWTVNVTSSTLTGRVRDVATNAAISGATVTFNGMTTTTNTSGVYSLTNVACVSSTLMVSKSGYVTTSIGYSLAACGGTSTKDVTLTAWNTNKIDGFASRTKNGVREDTPVFLKRVNDNGPVDPTKRSWLVIHGRGSNSAAMKEITDALVTTRPGDQVLVLDWSVAADDTLWVSSEGEGWIQPVGEWGAKALAGYGFRGTDVNEVGHSWGSYVAQELAERMPFTSPNDSARKVNSIVALDPAANTVGSSYNVNDIGQVNLQASSTCSWAFHVTRIYGNEYTPTTASEAFVVRFDNVAFEFDAHSLVKGLFAYIIQHPNEDPSKYFKTDRLLACQAGPWTLNGFAATGLRQAGGGYEGKINATETGLPSFEEIPYSIDSDSLPDLTVGALNTSAGAVYAGASFTVTDTTWNQGVGAAAATTTRYRLSADSTISTADILLTGARSVPSLFGNEYSSGSVAVTIPSGTAPGNYYVGACADDLGTVTESTESNNCRASATTLSVTNPSSAPDLLLTALTGPTSGTVGGTLAVSVTVKNQASTAGGAYRLGFYFSTSPTYGSSAVYSGSYCGFTSGTGTGVSQTCSGSIMVPVSLSPGGYYLIAYADDQSQVTEANESNNWLAATTGPVTLH